MRVLLIPQKNNYPDPRVCLDIFGQGFPYLAGALKAAGHEVFGINMNIHWCHGSAPLTLERLLREAIEKYNPHLIGVGGLSADYIFVRDAILFTRQIAPDIPIVCGGNIITYDADYIFSNLRPDFAVIGEGEKTVVALTDCLEKGGNITNIPNIAFWKDGKPVYTRVEDTNKSLDNLPLPDYSPFDYERFLEHLNQADNNFYAHTRHKPRVMPMTLGRSCPFDCTFCCHTMGPKYRERSINSAIEEIIYFYNKYKFNVLFIYDEVFAMRKERVIEFCRKIKKLKDDFDMDFDWTCDLRVNNVERDILKEMKDSGCSFIGYGFESASPKVLKSMKKRITVDQMIKAIRLTEEAGIGVQGNFILGDLAETPETIQETKSFFDKWCTRLMIHFTYLSAYPGTEIFQYCIDNGIIADKQQYYNNTGCIGRYRLNMTKMPDEIFYELAEHLSRTTALFEHNFLTLKNISVLSCERIGPFKPDSDAPFLLRRSLYKIRVVCPYCRELVDYLYPLRINATDDLIKLRTYCAKCHKRFLMNIPEGVREPSEKNPIEHFYSFDGVNSFVGSSIQPYKSYNILEGVWGSTVYAVPHSLGCINPNDIKQIQHPEILKAKTYDEVKTLIDNKL